MSIGLKTGRDVICLSLFFLLYGCVDKNYPTDIEPIEKYLTDSFTVNLNDTISNKIALIDADNNKASFLDYYMSRIYVYNLKTKMFEYTYNIPHDSSEIPNLLEYYYSDSVIYYSMYNKEIIICKGNEILARKPFLKDREGIYMYSRGECIQDSSYYYFALYLKSVKKNYDYYYLNSQLPLFARIHKNLSNSELLPLHYRIKESKKHLMIQNHIVYDVDKDNNIYFCFGMTDTIYKYNCKTNQLFKYFNLSAFTFSPIFFDSDTCKDIEMTRYNLNTTSSSVLRLIYDKKNRLLIRILKYYHPENKEKKVYCQIFDDNVKLLKTLFLPDRYYSFPYLTQNGDIFLNHKKSKTHVYKKINFGILH